VAKFRENRPRDVEKSVLGKKICLPLSVERYAGDCNKCDQLHVKCVAAACTRRNQTTMNTSQTAGSESGLEQRSM